MISLDQVYLLEQKVESAVAKIQQLQAENDALRNKCAELTNALTAKSEQLSSIEQDQSQIESGIKKALDRLNSIENSVLKAAGQAIQQQQVVQMQTANVEPAAVSKPESVQTQTTQTIQEPVSQIQQTQSPVYTENQTIAEAQAIAQATAVTYTAEQIQQVQNNQPAQNIQQFQNEQTVQPIQETVEVQQDTQSTEQEQNSLFAQDNLNKPNFDSMQPAFGYNQQEAEDDFAENADEMQDDEQNPGFDIF
ncbi:MAG: cell division protein ZapB [Treponema sp.]|nr:cell division protein ZapB [Treponema sp.]